MPSLLSSDAALMPQVATIRDTVGGDTPNIRAICAAGFRPEMTASAISRRLVSSSFLRRIPNVARPEARAEGAD